MYRNKMLFCILRGVINFTSNFRPAWSALGLAAARKRTSNINTDTRSTVTQFSVVSNQFRRPRRKKVFTWKVRGSRGTMNRNVKMLAINPVQPVYAIFFAFCDNLQSVFCLAATGSAQSEWLSYLNRKHLYLCFYFKFPVNKSKTSIQWYPYIFNNISINLFVLQFEILPFTLSRTFQIKFPYTCIMKI